MKYKITLGVSSLILLLFTIVVGISQYGLVLTEYDSIDFSELHYYPIIRTLFPICCILTLIFFIAFVLSLKNEIMNGKRFWIVFIISAILFVTIIISTIFISYRTAIFEDYHTNIMLDDDEAIKIDSEHKHLFPYYDKILEYGGTNLYYSYNRCEIPQAVYIHVQNNLWDANDVTYDVEYFKTDDEGLLSQYKLQKATPIYFDGTNAIFPLGTQEEYEDINFTLYQCENYYEIRVINASAYYSIVFKNFNEMTEVNKNEFITVAMEQFEIMQKDAKVSHGEPRNIFDEI